MLELFYQTGIRLSELIGLTLKDIQGNQIKVLGKSIKKESYPSLMTLFNRFRSTLNFGERFLLNARIFCCSTVVINYIQLLLIEK